MYKRVIIIALMLLNATIGVAQEQWKLSTNKDGIKVYTKPVTNSKIKAIKAECNLKASLSQFVAVILDINTCDEWVYHTKSSTIIKRVSPAELYYYSQVQVPWPAQNRDFVAHISISQNPKTKIITIDAPCVPGFVPVKEDIVRINQSKGQWLITPLEKGMIKVEYELAVDPGGLVPAWLVNLFATQGPSETFKKLKVHLQKPVYRDARFPFITN